jgi:hypothetical protein
VSQQKLLGHVAAALRELDIPFMLTGSLVSSLQGEPRSTHDIDLVVDLSAGDVEKLLAAFASDSFYLSESAIREAIDSRGMFNLLDTTGGDKVDFWILTPEPFDQSRFARRRTIAIAGVDVDLSRPEDTILAKLRWAQLSGGSQRQLHDAKSVYELNRDQLDRQYIEYWVAELKVTSLWDQLVSDT